MLKQVIRIIRIIVSRTPAIHMCPEWIWTAPLLSEVPEPPHHPNNLCYHLLWWTIYWCCCRRRFRMSACLINELHIGPSNPVWTLHTLIARFMRPIWGRQDPCGPHVSPMNFAIWVLIPSVLKSIEISLIIVESRKRSKYGQGTFETMTGCMKQLQAYNAVTQTLP